MRLAALEIVAVFGVGLLALRDTLDVRLFALMAAAYLASAGLNLATGRGLLHARTLWAVRLVLACAFCVGALLLPLTLSDPVPALALAMIAGFVARESGFLDAVQETRRVAGDAGGVAIAALAALQPLALAGAIALAGVLGSWHPGLPFALAAAGATVAVVAALRAPRPARTHQTTTDLPIPRAARLQCLLSSAHNSISLVKNRVLLPVYVVTAAQTIGLGQHAFAVLGTAAGAVAAFALIGSAVRRHLKGTGLHPERMMLAGLTTIHLSLVAWGALGILHQTTGADWLLIPVAVAILAQTVASQAWSVGFFTELSRKVDAAGPPDTAPARLNACTRFWQTGKNLGAPLGFLAAGVFAERIAAHSATALAAIGLCGLLFAGCYLLLVRRADDNGRTA